MTARKKLKLIETITADRKRNYELSQNMPKEVILITEHIIEPLLIIK